MINKIKVILQWGIVLLALILGYSLVKSIIKIAGSSGKVEDARREVQGLKKENEDLNKELMAVQSVQFIEKEARDKLGLAKKGEIVVVLPDDETLRSLAPKVEEKTSSLPDPNWKQWLKLFK